MNNIFELLLNKLIVHLNELNMGCTINSQDLSEMWWLLHILHCVSYDCMSDRDVRKILDYYE